MYRNLTGVDLEIFRRGFCFSGIATSVQLQVEDQKKKSLRGFERCEGDFKPIVKP